MDRVTIEGRFLQELRLNNLRLNNTSDRIKTYLLITNFISDTFPGLLINYIKEKIIPN